MADVEENEPDAETPLMPQRRSLVSDESSGGSEYDSILQELNSSTPMPLDSSGENALDALFTGRKTKVLPALKNIRKPRTMNPAPPPAESPVSAGRRDSYILTVDAKDRIETEDERREIIWHEIKTAYCRWSYLTGTWTAWSKRPSGITVVVLDYKGFRVAIH